MPASLEGVGGHRDKSMSNGHGECVSLCGESKEGRSVGGIKLSKLLSEAATCFFGTSVPQTDKVQTGQTENDMTGTRDTSHDVQLVNPVPPAVTRLANQRAAKGRSSRVGSDLEAFQTSVW